MSGGEGPERAARVTHPTVAGDDARPRRRAGGRGIKFRVPIAAPPAAAGAIAEKENRPAPHSSRAGCRPDTPGLTEQRETPHAAATCGVLTGLAGSRPPGPGANVRYSVRAPDSSADAQLLLQRAHEHLARAPHRRVAHVEVRDDTEPRRRP